MSADFPQVSRNLRMREQEIGSHLLLYDPVNDVFHALNLAGKLIWNLYNPTDGIGRIEETFKMFFGDAEQAKFRPDILRTIATFGELEIFTGDTREAAASRDVRIAKPEPHVIPYEAPKSQRKTTDWMKENHPAAFAFSNFSDTWSPGC